MPYDSSDGGQWTSGGESGAAEVMPAQEILGRLPPWVADLLRGGKIGKEELELPKKPIPGLSGKEAADSPPDWVRGEKPMIKETGKDFAKRLMDQKYGPGKYPRGPDTEFNKIRKWGDRHFRVPTWFEDQFRT